MIVERDIARTAISFTVGFIISALASYRIATTSWAAASAAFSLIAACTAVLMHPLHNKLSDRTLQALIGMTFLCLGYFVSDIGRISSILGNSTPSAFEEIVPLFGEKMKILIRNVPFQSENTGSLITALLTGDRSGLDTGILTAFRKSGASHILALSGLHLGIIYGIFKGILLVFGNGRTPGITRAVIVVCLCGFYTLATGAGASITRAFIFITLNEISYVTGRYRSTGSILWAALVIHLFLFPGSIRDVGFQLSYAAMLGIAYIYPYLKNFWPHSKEGRISKGLGWTWKSAAMSISCQITTGPLAWIYFGTFPRYFLLTNLIALPLIGLIIPSSLAVICLHTLGACPDFMIRATEWMICGLIYCLDTIAGL